MLITDSFVMLNMPKTGSSFVREAIKNIYVDRRKKAPVTYKLFKRIKPLSSFASPRIERYLFIKELKMKTSDKLPKNQHGFYSQIPSQYRNKEIVSVARNPYDRFLSTYKYRWWAHSPRIDKETILKYLPSYPNLSIDEYVDLLDLFSTHASDYKDQAKKANIGQQTSVFIRMFSKNAASSFAKTDDNKNAKEILDDFPKITFLRQENLAEELADFLERKGYSRKELSFIKGKEKVNTSRESPDDGKELWTSKSLSYIREKENLLFQILEHFGASYSVDEYEKSLGVTL